MIKVKIAFEPRPLEEAMTIVDQSEDKFVPEMSMDVKTILSQFAFVDNVRLQDIMKNGYIAGDDDDDFELPDFDLLDIAEKQAYYEHSKEFIRKFEESQKVTPVKEDPAE